MARRKPTIGAVWALAVLCPFALAANEETGLWRYAHRAWTPQNSALRSGVRAIAQTPDGYLWLGVDSGLIRFDGVRMVPWTPPPGQQLPGTPEYLIGARDGTLWIGTTGGLASLRKGRLTQYPVLSGFFVSNLLEDRDGSVWATGAWGNQSRKARLCQLRNESATCYGDDGAFGGGVGALYEEAGGDLWIAAGTVLWRWRPGPPVRYDEGADISALTQSENGSGLTVTLGGKVRRIAGGSITDYPLPGAPLPLTAGRLLRDRKGALWIATSRGLLYSHQGTTRLITHTDGLSSDMLSKMFEDREGTIWICTTEGLDSFRELPLASLSIAGGLPGNSIRGVLAARDGSIWIGTQTGLYRWTDGRMRAYRGRTDPGLPGDDIGTLFEDERGRIWVQAYPGVAVFEAGSFHAVPSVPRGTITAIASDRRGGLWLQMMDNPNDYGLVHLVDGKLIQKVPWRDLGGSPGTGLVVDPDGGVWTALFSGGIAHFHDGQIRTLQLSQQDTGSRRVFNLSRERDGALWAATENGLTRIADGRVSTLTTANGLPCNVVHWIIDDDVSSYWLYTACGLLRIARNELNAWTADPKRKIQLTLFDSADGVPLRGMLLPWRPHVTEAPDGRIWFGNGGAVSVIHPSHIAVNTLPPPVHIEQITADDKTYAARPGLHLPPLVRNVTIDYTALSFVAPEKVHFRYKLEGQDPDWREVVNDREVQYSNLPPRGYRFRVMASNNSGVWNEADDALQFSIDPAYYQSNWFKAGGVAALFLILWGLYQLRLYQIAREFNAQLEGRVEERLRVARELHDTLLQNFQASLVQMQSARNLVSRRPEHAAQRLDDAITMAAGAVAEGRGAIQELRRQPADQGDLESLLSVTGQDLARSHEGQDHPASFRLIMEGERRQLKPLLQDEVYRIARELLRNAFQHARASQIEAEIRYEERLLCVIVRDNGKGIDPEVLKAGGREGHWGLAGIRERAKRSGARVDFWSETGAGTEVQLTIPASLAYQANHTDGWFQLVRKKRASS